MSREDILARLRERIVAFAASRTGGRRDLAEDLAQEVLTVLETRYAGVDTLEELLPLSLQILRLRMDAASGADAWAEQRELLDRLKQALPELGERCRELFRLKLLGRTFPEIQEEMEANSVNTVYAWDARCRQKLLEMVGGRWVPKGRK